MLKKQVLQQVISLVSGVGYYTYGERQQFWPVLIHQLVSGLDATTSGFSYAGLNSRNTVQATFVVYQTCGTTLPAPASGDYLFYKNIGSRCRPSRLL